MLDKNNSFSRSRKFWLLNFVFALVSLAVEVRAQMAAVPASSPVAEAGEDFTWWYFLLGALSLCLIGAIAWIMKNKKAEAAASKSKKAEQEKNRRETESLDANKEMEWLRKNPKLAGKTSVRTSNKKRSQTGGLNNLQTTNLNKNEAGAVKEMPAEVLPVFAFKRIENARPFTPLQLSNDEALMSAIEQTHDEFEEDEELRDLALRILTQFKTRNSIEALSQMAIYDLSANLRSKAVLILGEFNHESVFEPILQASADPTREVRAAAARVLSKLTFDRADAWTRIFESGEEGRMRQAARAAVASGFVEMSFDRLVHPDAKYSYEAATLMALLIKAGETDEIFRGLESHKNMNVRRAILHVIKITKDQKALDGLYSLLEGKKLPLELQEEVDKTIEEIGFVTV